MVAANKTKKERAPARRAASLKGLTYQRLKDYCDAQGASVSGTLEKWINDELDARGAPVPDPKDCPQRKKSKSEPDPEIVSAHFTF